MKRLIFIDNLKLNLVILVILHHIVLGYGGAPPIILLTFNAINQSFFMSLFFLLSGFFLVGSLERKSTLKFIKDRLIKLGIPIVGYIVLISPIIDYITIKYYKGMDVSFFETFSIGWKVGPLWFVEALLILSFIYIPFRSGKNIAWFKDRFPSNIAIVVTILIVTIMTFILRIFFPVDTYWHVFQLGHFVPYGLLFYLGIVAYKNNWFEHLSGLKPWLYVALGSIIVFPLMAGTYIALFDRKIELFLGGFGWKSFLFSFWNTIACFSIILSLLYIFKKKFDTQGKLAKWASSNYYGAYIFHILIILLATIPLLGLAIPDALKTLIVAVVAIPLSFAFTALVRKIPLVNKIIG